MTRHIGPIEASWLRRVVVGWLLGAVLWAPCASEAQQQAVAPAAGGADENAQLAKKLSNPVSDLVSVPFQFNWEQGIGPGDDTRFVLNVQPVMPFSLNKNLNLISRVTVPVNLLFAKLSLFGPFPASYQFGGGVFVAQPDTGPEWKIRAAIVILLPRRK